ncbi:MAG TPA: pyrroloquinoline quinone biosynthesis peptide chaperone PqqD [Polyangia bacterium]|nr:pyrroloquinoline quinone biosynthesis peptide chaperone PqqD [Polyangia bacterium]
MSSKVDFGARPRLAPKVRLREDRVTGQSLLLYPERGLALNETAAEIVRHCTGEATVTEIIEQLVAKYGAEKREVLTAEVEAFLQSLADRNLLRGMEQ